MRVATPLLVDFGPELNPHSVELDPIEFAIDGYNINSNFMGTGRDFMSTKQLHFDIVEPIGSNLYGPNLNVVGGLPVFADARDYCAENAIKITSILRKIPGSRNLTVAEPHYSMILRSFSVAIDVDMQDDMPFSIVVNRVVEAGLLHGATAAYPINPDQSVVRPLWHFALDNITAKAADQWYEDLGQTSLLSPGNPAGRKELRSSPSSPLPPIITMHTWDAVVD